MVSSLAGCNKLLMNELKRIMTVRCLAYFNPSSTQEHFEAFAPHISHSLIVKNITKVMKILNKEETKMLFLKDYFLV